jgi:opacity protein-like surface antigen
MSLSKRAAREVSRSEAMYLTSSRAASILPPGSKDDLESHHKQDQSALHGVNGMKSKALLGLLLVSPATCLAVNGYIQGSVGYGFGPDVDVQGSATTVEAGTISGFSADYDDNVTFGLELGIRNFERHNVLRIGIGWDRFDADLDQVSFQASGGSLLPAGTYTVSRGDIAASGLDFDNTVDIYSLNLYYDFPSSTRFKFFIGAGVGLADIENADDNELTLRASIGGRYHFNENMYLGLRWNHFNIDGPKDGLGLSYDDISVNNVSATLGYEF